MSWLAKSGKVYQLCLLDTNAISEILKYPKKEGFGFLKYFPPTNYAPCFTVYSLFELRRNRELYKLFIEMFSVYPLFLLKPQSVITNLEFENYDQDIEINPILNSFSPLGKNNTYNLSLFIDKLLKNKNISLLEQNWRFDEKNTLSNWLKSKSNFTPKSKYPNKNEAEKYISEAALKTIIANNLHWCKEKIEHEIIPDINKFPSLQMMLYSLYYRLYDPSWIPKTSEVTDIRIISVVPYVDCFITEKFQSNINTKIRKNVQRMDVVKTYRIRDLL